MKDFHERADGLCRSQDTSELLKLMEEWKGTTVPTSSDLDCIVSKWVDYSPVSLLNRPDTPEDSDDEFALWMLHWNTFKDVPKSRSDEWTFLYGDDLFLDGDLTEKQFTLRKLVIEVRNAKKRFLLQKISFRDEDPINIDPHCIATVKNIFYGRDFSYYITLITKFLNPIITDENSLLVIEKLWELGLECNENQSIISYLRNYRLQGDLSSVLLEVITADILSKSVSASLPRMSNRPGKTCNSNSFDKYFSIIIRIWTRS